ERTSTGRSMKRVNRKLAAAPASLHLAPTELAARFLRAEAVASARIRVVGNPVIDVLRRLGARARPVAERDGVVVTAHRATNVDDPDRLGRLVDLVRRAAVELGAVRFPVHPRTRARLEESGGLAQL